MSSQCFFEYVCMGRVYKDPELSESGVLTVTLKIEHQRYDSKSKGFVDHTTWVRQTFFGTPAKYLAKVLREGVWMCVSGDVETNVYVNKEGKKIYSHNFKPRSNAIRLYGLPKAKSEQEAVDQEDLGEQLEEAPL